MELPSKFKFIRVKFKNNLMHLQKKNLILTSAVLSLLIDALEYSIEYFAKFVMMAMPLAVYVFLMQSREKPTSTTSIGNHLTDKSTMQLIGPGVLLVCLDGKEYKENIRRAKKRWKDTLPAVMYVTKLLACIAVTIASITIVSYLKLKGQ